MSAFAWIIGGAVMLASVLGIAAIRAGLGGEES
jgi:hypothetical protein